MRLHRFIGEYDLLKKEIEITNPENVKQIKNILRLKKGDNLILSNGKGKQAQVSIISLSKEKIICSVQKVEEIKEIKRKVNLFLAILKKENFETAVQKAVECGVTKITPIITERTIKTGLNIERLNKIMLEASEQSGRGCVPILSPVLNFKDALTYGGIASVGGDDSGREKIIFDPTGNLYTPNKEVENISIFVGPEGGFTPKEIDLAKKLGYAVCSLGSLVLRAETAAIIATYRTVKGN